MTYNEYMKNKKIKKLAKLLHEEMRSQEVYAITESYLHDADQETSDKFFNFVCNLLKLQGKLNIHITSDNIIISGDLDQFEKTKSANWQNGAVVKTTGELEVVVDKFGFRINRGWSSRASYKDDKIFERLLPAAIEIQKVVNKEVINDLIDDIMVLTKLSRENNLKELLS